MPRLIDADEAYKVLTDYYHHGMEIQHEALKEALSKVPTVEAVPVAELPYTVWLTHDVVQIVRCKDCKYWSNNECIYCYFEDNPNGYCAWGERREDAETD